MITKSEFSEQLALNLRTDFKTDIKNASVHQLHSAIARTVMADIAPEWAQGGRNEPANLARYAAILAELRGIDVAEVIAATGRNALEVLRWTRAPSGC